MAGEALGLGVGDEHRGLALERRAARGDADDRERRRAIDRPEPDAGADPQAAATGEPGIDDDLARPRGRPARAQRQRRQRGARPAVREGVVATGAGDGAVGAEDLRADGDVRHDAADAGTAASRPASAEGTRTRSGSSTFSELYLLTRWWSVCCAGDDDRSARVALGRRGAAQSRRRAAHRTR